MAVVNQPPILASSFAVNGDKNTIPATNSGTEGLASLSLGFPSITSQPVSQGGIPPQREDFNGIFNLITNFLMFLQNGSVFAYSSTLDYQPPAIVYGNNALYRCVATNGANTSAGVQPLSNTAYWKPLIPVGAITISGNVITVTNETGAQTQYTIDTINNPPTQSDSSNKIVTSAWVKAYAPSKSGSGASGTWNITANKAIADKNGLQIDTGYLKLSGGQMTGNYIVAPNNAVLFLKNGSQAEDGMAFWVSNSTGAIGIIDYNRKEGTQDVFRCVPNGIPNFGLGLTSQTPSTTDNSNRVATTAFVHNYAPSKSGSGASGTWGINISGNANTANSATKATQDNTGRNITGYLYKEEALSLNADSPIVGSGSTIIPVLNALITKIKQIQGTPTYTESPPTTLETLNNIKAPLNSPALTGTPTAPTAGTNTNNTQIATTGFVHNYAPSKSGSGASGTWNITANKANQDGNGNTISSTYLKLSGGQMTGNYIVAPNNAVLFLKNGSQAEDGMAFWVSNSTGAIGIIDYNRKEGTQDVFRCVPNGIPNFGLGLTSQTPSTTDNSNRVATTAFVKSLFTASKATNGWHKEASTGIIWQWGQEANYHDLYILDGQYASSTLKFPISFPNACLGVNIYMLGTATFCCASVSSFDKTKVTVHWDEWEHAVQSVKFGYVAVGY